MNIAVTTPATTNVWNVELMLSLKLLYAKFSINLTHNETNVHAIIIIMRVSKNLKLFNDFIYNTTVFLFYNIFDRKSKMSVSTVIQNKILEAKTQKDKKQEASPSDIIELFEYLPDSRFITLMYEGIKSGVINPNDVLLYSVEKMNTKEYVYLSAIALRYGANPNEYISNPSIGVVNHIHILAYLYRAHTISGVSSYPYFELMILLLVYYGSNPQRKLYDNAPIEGSNPTVAEWLVSSGYQNSLLQLVSSWREITSPQTQTLLAILTSVKELIQIPITELDIEKILIARSNSLLEVAPQPKLSDPLDLDYSVLYWCIQNYELDAIAIYASMGILPSYALVSILLLLLRENSKGNNPLFFDILSNILEVWVNNGVDLDKEQFNYLETTSKSLNNRILNIYTQPYWVKACKPTRTLPNDISDKLLSIANGIGIEEKDYVTISKQLRNLSKFSISSILQAAKNRRLAQFGSKHSYITEFASLVPTSLHPVQSPASSQSIFPSLTPSHSIPTPIHTVSVPVLYCSNRSTIVGDYGDYSDVSVSSYRDYNGQVWCFLSTHYKELLMSGKNPDNNLELPISFLDELEEKLKLIHQLGLNEKSPLKLSDVLAKAFDPDRPTDEVTNVKLDHLYKYVSKRRLISSDLESILASMNYRIRLKSMDEDLAIATFAYIVDYILNEDDKDKAKTLSRTLKNL